MTIATNKTPRASKKSTLEILAARLAELEIAQLVRRFHEEEATFIFKHTLTQETAYASLLKQSRREIHHAVAQAYEEEFGNRCLDDYAAILAQHYFEAGVDAKTFEYANRAGHIAMQTYACTEAVMHFTRAIDAAQRLEPQHMGSDHDARSSLTDCYLHRGRAFEMTGQFQKAVQNYEELESIAHERNDRAMQLAALVALATIHSTPTAISDPEHARSLSNLALELAREIGDRKTESRVLWNLMLLSTLLSEMPRSIDYAEQSLAISRDLGLREQTALTLNDLSRPYMTLRQFDRAHAAIQEALEYFRETNNQPMMADCLGRFAAMNLALGRFDELLHAAQSAQKISASIGNLWGQSFSRMFAGLVYFERGEISSAIETMRECVRFAEQSGFSIPQVQICSELASLYGAMGDVTQGIERAKTAHTVAIERLPHFESKPCAALARLYVLKGDLVQAEANLKKGYATLKDDFAQQVANQLPLAEIEIALAKKDYARAIQTADESFDHFDKMGFHIYRSHVLYLKATALRLLGNENAAYPVFQQAKSEAEQIGSRWILWQIHAALGERDQARDVIGFIAAHTPPGLRESFLNLPDVRAVMNPQ